VQDLAACRFLNLYGSLSKGACRARTNRDVRSFVSQCFRDGAAQPFAGSCDDGYAAREP